MKKNTLRLMAVIAAAFIFLGCEFVLPEYRVTYSTEHGIAPYSIKVVKNNVLTQEQLPELKVKGYTFNGWVNSANNRQVTAGYRIVEDLNLKALWTKSETDSESKPDVPNNEQNSDNSQEEIVKTKISDYVTITKTQADITAVLPENIGPNPFAGNTYRYEYSFDNGYQVSTYSVDLEFIDENTFLLDGEEYTYSYVNTSDKHKLILKPEKITATEWENSHCTYENTQELVHQKYDGEVGEELYSYAVYREFNSFLYFEYELNGDILKLKQVMPDTIEEYLTSLSPADDVSFQEEIGDGCFEWFDEYGIGNFSYTFNEREYEFCPLEVKDGAITYIQLPPYGAEYSIAIIPYEYYPEEGKLILTYGGNNHTYILNQNDFQEFNKVN